MSEKRHIGLTDKQLASVATDVDPALLAEGYELVRAEKEMTFRQAMRYHWRAVAWSMFLSLALVMDGMDGAMVNSFFGLPAFLNKFGWQVDGKQTITADWIAAMQNIGIPGGFLGLWLCGWGQTRFGSKKVYLYGMAFTFAVGWLFIFAVNLPMLLGAEALAACAWAIFNTLSAAYAAEICPIQLRGLATSFISMCWGSGSFIASGILRGALNLEGDWGWRLPYCLQLFWPIVLFTGCLFAPESPWWLARNGREEEAKRVLIRNATPGYWATRNIDAYLAVIKHTDQLEQAEAKSGSFREMWKGTNLRRTEIQMGLWASQVWSGTAMTAYAVVFLQAAGMSTTASFNFNILITSMNLIGCAIEFVLLTRFGRRPMIILGLNVLAVMLLLIGIFGSVAPSNATLQGIGACCAVINLVYHITVGPLTYTVAAEVPAARLRAKSVAWGRAFYTINYQATNQLTPRMVSTAAGGWQWGAKAAYFWLGGNLGVTLWAYFRLPETGGLSFTDLDILFANKISARKFKSVVIQDEVAMDRSDAKSPTGEKEQSTVEHMETPRTAVLVGVPPTRVAAFSGPAFGVSGGV